MNDQSTLSTASKKLFMFLTIPTLAGLLSGETCPKMEVLRVVDKSQEKAPRAYQSGSATVYAASRPLLTFADFTSANVSVTEGQLVLNVNLTAESAKRMQEFTAKHVGDRLVYAVNGKVVRVPKVLDPLTGSGFLIGPFPKTEGQELADAINGKVPGCRSSAK